MPMPKGAKVTRNIFAAYRGDTYIMEGTADDIAKRLGVSREYVLWCNYPAAKKRAEDSERKQHYHSKGRLHVVLLERLRGRTHETD